jgi:predicted RNA-binding protein with PUA-like domain
VDVKPERKLGRAVLLSEIKADPELGNFELVRLPRLSVMPVAETVWKHLLAGH